MRQLTRELQEIDYLEQISEIQFGIFSEEDIKNGSVANILTPETYDGNIPKNNGLFDHNMGSIDAAIICPIDEKKAELCPGYFGKIDLALPVFNYHFIPYIEKILKCICFRCSTLLFDKTEPNALKELKGKKGHSRFLAVVNLCSKNKKCIYNNGCNALQPVKYMNLNASNIKEKNNIIKIIGEFTQNAFKDNKVLNQQVFTPLVCYQIFKRIKDEDVDMMGFSSKYSRPEWMIITSLLVPPPSVRPSVRQADNQRSEDDLTYALASIVKSNKSLKHVLENNANNNKMVDNYQGTLQYLVATYMDNEIPGVAQNAQRSTYRPLKAITQRLKGKEGRLRGNIMGKRVDFSARTVISVDPNINIDEFGVPLKIAMNLTFPETVTKYSIETLKKYILNGPKKYPGAKMVTITKSKVNISLKHVDVVEIANKLEYGDIVHRHLIDGDVCLFNRQPTLHRMSMMGHRIRVLPYSTFRLNVSVCKPYNADFDGDEMNMHIPQSVQTHIELEKICLVPQHIISPGTSTPSIFIVQDTAIGAYLLTYGDIRLTKEDVYNYMMFKKGYRGNLPEPEGYHFDTKEPYWSGRQLYSLILPDISIHQLSNIKVLRGEITSGYLDKDAIGKSAFGLIKQIYNTYGTEKCYDFLNDTQNLITRWMTRHSLTVGFGDCVLNQDKRNFIKDAIHEHLEESKEIIRKTQAGLYMVDLDDIYKKNKLEGDIKTVYSKLNMKISDFLVKELNNDNNLYKLVVGAKSIGTNNNIVQIMGLVGQQDIWGRRVEDGFTCRTLPHFGKNDLGTHAKGFCMNSFIEGLTPSETFFHAMSGRCGSIDTAIKTADSGYTSKKLIKAVEDLKVNYDFTVRNASNHIVQFAYGDDHFDPIKLEYISQIELITLNNKDLENKYKFTGINQSTMETFMTPDAIFETLKDNEYMKLFENDFHLIKKYQDDLRYNYFKNTKVIGEIGAFCPIHLYTVIPNILTQFHIEPYHLCDLTPQYIIENYNQMLKDLVQYLPEKDENWKLMFILFKSFLSLKRIMFEYRMSRVSFDYLITYIKKKVINALISPGEMVGIVSAQTLGQISTQLTLNTFHFSGIASGSLVITEGLPRLREIMNLTKNLKNQNMSIYLKEEYARDKEKAKLIQTKFGYTQIKDILSKTEILYDNKNGMTEDNEDYEFIKSYKEFAELFDIDNIPE